MGEMVLATSGRTKPNLQRRRNLLGRVVVAGMLVALAMTIAPAFGAESDPAVIAVSLATSLVATAGIFLVVTVPHLFGIFTVSVGGAFVVSMNMVVLLGVPLVFAEMRQEAPTAAVTFVSATLLSYVLVVLTLLVVDAWFDRRTAPQRRLRTDYLFLIIGVGFVVVAAYAVVAWPVPVIDALLGARGSELADLRAGGLQLLNPPLLRYLFGFARAVLLPFGAAVTVAIAMERGSHRAWMLAIGTSALAVFAAVANVEKSLIPRLFLVIVLTAMLSSTNRRRPVLAVVSVTVAAAVPFLIARQGNSASTSSLDTLGGLARRATVLPSEVAFEYFRWTNDNGHLFGATLPYVSSLIPGGTVSLSTSLYGAQFASYAGQVGSASGAYVGFLWADFGWVGVIMGSIALGAILIGFDRATRLAGSDPMGNALRAVIFVQTAQLSSTSMFSSLLVFPFGLVDLVLFVIAVEVGEHW